jgi:micrococcal nuclease
LGELIRLKRCRSRRPKGQRPQWLPLLAFLAAATAGWLVTEGPSGGAGAFRLCGESPAPTCVLDGDTLIYGGVKIRLEDIDAPEAREPKCASEAELGQQATQRLLELMNAGAF